MVNTNKQKKNQKFNVECWSQAVCYAYNQEPTTMNIYFPFHLRQQLFTMCIICFFCIMSVVSVLLFFLSIFVRKPFIFIVFAYEKEKIIWKYSMQIKKEQESASNQHLHNMVEWPWK